MNVHMSARLTARHRANLVRVVYEGQTRKAVAAAFGIDANTVDK